MGVFLFIFVKYIICSFFFVFLFVLKFKLFTERKRMIYKIKCFFVCFLLEIISKINMRKMSFVSSNLFEYKLFEYVNIFKFVRFFLFFCVKFYVVFVHSFCIFFICFWGF